MNVSRAPGGALWLGIRAFFGFSIWIILLFDMVDESTDYWIPGGRVDGLLEGLSKRYAHSAGPISGAIFHSELRGMEAMRKWT